MTRVTCHWLLLSAFLPFAETSAHIPESYKYDAAQNLNVRTNNTTAQSFPVNAENELTGGTYDANGNLTSDGNRTFTYDHDNRLVSVEAFESDRAEFTYDGFSRLRIRKDYTWNGVSHDLNAETRFIYDRRLVIQERTDANTPAVAYTRGTDLSGTLQGAGGIGGMLSRSHGYAAGNWNTHHAYHADAGGNITAMVNTSQTLSATYRLASQARH